MKTFHRILANALVTGVMSYFVWFALIFWVYLETKSVLATSVIGGAFALFSAFCGIAFGTFVDRHRKHAAMVVSSVASVAAFGLATIHYALVGPDAILRFREPHFWIFVTLVLVGSVAGNLRQIALMTTVTLLVPAGERDKANGLVGTVMGVSFTITSVLSGFVVGRLGMGWALGLAIVVVTLALGHLLTIRVDEDAPAPPADGERQKAIDVRGAYDAIKGVPGLGALILFTSFNNLLGGVFMALLDAYGLSLVSVEAWGVMFGIVSLGFIAGGMVVARKGLGGRPMRAVMLGNLVAWTSGALFTLQSQVWMLFLGMLVWMALTPAIEAAEQTVLQRVVPYEQQGRVFGLAQTVEQGATPITAFLIGPVAQLWVIPFMDEGGTGADAIGGWFGIGPERGMALIFTIAGVLGVVASLVARSSRWFRSLDEVSRDDRQKGAVDGQGTDASSAGDSRIDDADNPLPAASARTQD